MSARRIPLRQVLAWRMRRQLLDPVEERPVADVISRLCGVQAQVSSSADASVAVRRRRPGQAEVTAALRARGLVRTWAMRGTLHVFTPDEAGAYLALVGAARSWERPSWLRAFGVTAADMGALVDAAAAALDGQVLSRDELVGELITRTGGRHLEEQLRSGWGALFKPLAYQGLLCNGPGDGGKVTFTSPASWLADWPGVPPADVAARVVIPAYLRAYGPATMATFDAWLMRGTSKRALLRGWFATVDDQLVTVEVEGQERLMRAEDVDELAAARPSRAVRLLPGFDQFVLGPGTGDVGVVPAQHRSRVSRTSGWISPVVVSAGRVVGVWQVRAGTLGIELFPETAADVPRRALAAEAERVGAIVGSGSTLAATVTVA